MKDLIQLFLLFVLTVIQLYSAVGKRNQYKANPDKYTPKQVRTAHRVMVAVVVLVIFELLWLGHEIVSVIS